MIHKIIIETARRRGLDMETAVDLADWAQSLVRRVKVPPEKMREEIEAFIDRALEREDNRIAIAQWHNEGGQ